MKVQSKITKIFDFIDGSFENETVYVLEFIQWETWYDQEDKKENCFLQIFYNCEDYPGNKSAFRFHVSFFEFMSLLNFGIGIKLHSVDFTFCTNSFSWGKVK